MIKTIPIVLFALLLGAVIGMDLRYAKHHDHAQHIESERGENLEARQVWDYLRLRDPATGEIPYGIHTRELQFAHTLANAHPALKGTSSEEILSTPIQTTGWISAGPINVGGRTREIGIDISNEANVLIATAQGGIYRSTDSGESWVRTTALDQVKDNTCLVQDHRAGNTNIWYAGTGELISTTFRRVEVLPSGGGHTVDIGDGIYKSTDSGKSWTVLPSTYDSNTTILDSAFQGVWNIVVDNSNTAQNIVYAACMGAIMRSTDGGTSWTRVLGDPTHLSACSDVQITSTGVVYAFLSYQVVGSGTPSTAGVWRSTDGINWTNITPTSWPETGRMRIGIAPSNENILYIAGVTETSNALWKYDYLSGNGSGKGGVWQNRSANLPVNTVSGGFDGTNTQGGYNVTLKVYPTDTNLVFFGATNLFRATDGFATSAATAWIGGYYYWGDYDSDSGITYPNHHEDNHDVYFLPSNPQKMYSANDGGIFVTYNCLSAYDPNRPVEWQNLNHNDKASIFYVVAMDHAGPVTDSFVVGGLQDQASWITQSGHTWQQRGVGDGCYCAVADHKSFLYVSSQLGNIRQYELDTNLNIIDSADRRPDGINDPQFVTPWMLDPTNTNQMYFAANDSLWTNTDLSPESGHWETLKNCTVTSGTFITALGMSVVPAHTLYYGTSDGHVYRLDNANSTNPAPLEITSSIFPAGAFVSCIAVDPQNADSIVVCFSNYHVISIFASNDGGTTWHDASGNLEQNPDGSGNGPSVRWVSIVHQNGQELYLCGTSVGLFSTTDITGPNVIWNPEGTETIGYAIV